MDTEQKNILDGVIDLHVHTAPDVIHRTYNDLELTDAAVRAGARAIVIKGHHCGTVARASLCNAYNRSVHGDNSFYMYGGLVLNRETGGLNEQAVQTALRMGAKIIWLPTVDAENEYRKRGKTGGIRMTDSRGNLLPELLSIFSLIKAYDAVLGAHLPGGDSLCGGWCAQRRRAKDRDHAPGILGRGSERFQAEGASGGLRRHL